MSSKSAKSHKDASRFTEPIHPIKSSPPIKLNLVGRAKSLTGSGREGSSVGGSGEVVRSSGESHAVAPDGENRSADVIFKGLIQGSGLGKLPRSLSIKHDTSRSRSPINPSGNDNSDTNPLPPHAPSHYSRPQYPATTSQPDFIHLRSPSPSQASVHFLAGSEDVVFQPPTPAPPMQIGGDEYVEPGRPRARGKSFSSVPEEGESGLARFRAKRAAGRAAKGL
ncbi:hypothetical protein BC830DRAFT_800748 [Chytriomyces sp. MP71]|nr:hypothetical protein BC830DRAFT_800748 [Chytriomyces sp. MP71]